MCVCVCVCVDGRSSQSEQTEVGQRVGNILANETEGQLVSTLLTVCLLLFKCLDCIITSPVSTPLFVAIKYLDYFQDSLVITLLTDCPFKCLSFGN